VRGHSFANTFLVERRVREGRRIAAEVHAHHLGSKLYPVAESDASMPQLELAVCRFDYSAPDFARIVQQLHYNWLLLNGAMSASSMLLNVDNEIVYMVRFCLVCKCAAVHLFISILLLCGRTDCRYYSSKRIGGQFYDL